jgi:hypothetical protein
VGHWAALLQDEIDLRRQVEAEADVGCTLFEKFSPRPGGQSRFFEFAPIASTEPMDTRWLGLIGGIGSGKSHCGAAWFCSRMLLDPDSRGLVTANSYGQLARSSLMTLAEICRDFDIPLEPWVSGSVEDTALAIANRQRCYIGEDRAFVYVLSLNAFMGRVQSARGLQVRTSWIDEGAYAGEKSFQTLDGRLGRGPGFLKGQGLITSSPNGFNWIYDRFADPNRAAELKVLYVMFSCSTRDNVESLGEDYVQSLEANYTDELAAQELEGAFINTTTGRAYKYFDRAKHAMQGEDAEILFYDPNLDLHVSFDFNYSPATCTLAQVRGNEVHFFKEFFVMDSDTWEITSMVTEAIAQGKHQAEIYIYGDASGSARTAVSRQSNWDIVFNGFKDIGYHLGLGGRLHRRFAKANPPVKNRINSCNCLFKANRVYVDLEQCPELTKDWEVVGIIEGELDKTDPLRSHLSDAAGYLMHTLFPYKNVAIELRGNHGAVKGIAG